MRKLTEQDFRTRVQEKHGDRYSTRKSVYINNKVKVLVTCSLHGDVWVAPSNIFRHDDMICCRMEKQLGTKLDEPSNLYYVQFKIGDRVCYKIGITNLDVSTRYRSQKYQDFKILDILNFPTGREAFRMEQQLLHKFESKRYQIPKETFGDGFSELFTEDVLDCNNENILTTAISTL